MVFAGAAAATVNLLERPVVEPLARVLQRRRYGLLYVCRLPSALHVILAIILLDYTLYLWHVLAHRVSWLWRFHLVHHVDRDLDASTALRFHAGELALSIPWRAMQIAAIGVPPDALWIWQNIVLQSIMFHHSNVELPIDVERIVASFVVTPRIHGIHHSIVPEEMNSNWSSGLTAWDYLHGTLRLDVPQQAITIGVPTYTTPADVTLANSFALPFGTQRPGRMFSGYGATKARRQTFSVRELEP
jgi:sterol desaturase/sphingolipid hydroxylase (fatty acid hydroxylase superfamily)